MEQQLTPPKPRHRKKINYVVAILINGPMLYIANSLINWRAQFITYKWPDVLPIVNISIVISIVGYFLFLLYDRRVFYFLMKLIMDVFSIIVAYRLYTVFPFDFNGFFHMGWLNTWFPYLLIIGIIGVIIGIIVRTVRFATGKNIHY